ncbi:hypothetical protein PV08_05705 [Exophiala spinifera]|uniref:Zn(2)-C6 fungal-type domain-containing protein n=1 Tax=Exophiala spinifera TaxID=91928 RepID=A0A0D1YKV9_9EURO|nr:uncharacterized protein PV08_05705 [Exophiala spinifera]KIW15656.1 hypothetical protein PV08_05705 [Exophiala spinifera]
MASLTPYEDERRAKTPDYDDCGFYSKTRFVHILDLFREGQARDLALKSPSKTPISASTYDLRRRVCSYAHFAVGYEDKSSSDDDYDPATENRRRPVRNTGRAGGNQRSPRGTNQNGGGVDTDVGGLRKRQKIVPPRLQPGSSKEAPRKLATQQSSQGRSEIPGQVEQSGGGGDLVSPDSSQGRSIRPRGEPRDSYLGKLDEESAGIDNANGRALRNRTIPDQEQTQHEKGAKCAGCHAARKKCIWTIGHTCARCKRQDIECVKWTDDSPIETTPTNDASFTIPSMADDNMETKTEQGVSTQTSPLMNPQHVEASVPMNSRTSPDPSQLPIGSSANPIVLDSPPDSPLLSASPASIRQIVTHWAHPIDFKHVKNAGPCHFCTDFRFGVFGHGRITTKVIQYPGSTALEEIGDGHRSNGKEPTRMCVICALRRIYISKCTVHRFKHMDNQAGVQKSILYAQQLRAEVWDPPVDSTAYSTCKICPELADWRCCVDKTVGITGDPLRDGRGPGRGCGLQLCNTCKLQVEGCGGVLEKDRIMKADGKELRADVEFLFEESLLHRAYFPPKT